jgi:hypothetical protein
MVQEICRAAAVLINAASSSVSTGIVAAEEAVDKSAYGLTERGGSNDIFLAVGAWSGSWWVKTLFKVSQSPDATGSSGQGSSHQHKELATEDSHPRALLIMPAAALFENG